MPEGNALLTPNVSSYSNPTVNALLAAGGGGGGTNAMDTGTSQALGIANQAQQLQSGKVTIDQQTFNLAKAKLDAVHQLLGAVVANPSQSTLATQLGIGVKAGTVDPDTAADISAHVASFGDDRNRIQQFALDGLNNNASHQEILQQAFGSPGLLNTGGSTVSTLSRTGPNAGTTLSGAPPIANTVSPGERIAAGRVVTDGNGGKVYKPGSALYDDRGNYIGGGGAGASTNALGGIFKSIADGTAPPPAQGGQGQGAPAPTAGGWQAGGTPAPRGSMPGLTPVSPTDQSGSAPAAGQGGQPPASPPLPPVRPADAAPSAPASVASMGQGGTPAGMWTPGPQTMPVVTLEQAKAAAARAQTPQGTAADRNLLRGYAVQNNIPLQGKDAPIWEPQPGQPPQAAEQGGAPAAPAPAPGGGAVPPGRQPPTPAPVQAPASAPVQAPGARSPYGAVPGPMMAPGGGQGGQAPASGVGSGGMTDALSPGQQASLAAGANGYAALSADASAPTGVNQRVFQLRTAMDALRNTQTGLGTQQRQQLVGYMASLPGGLDKWMPGVDPNSAAAYDVATKYLNAYAMNTPGAARSDAALSTAQSANANTSGMMQKAAQDVTLSNIGLELGKRALANTFEKSGADPGTFNKFAQQWGQGVDPRAFALGDMTPAERGSLFSSLQGQQRANFLATVRKGIAANVISKNDLVGATGGQ